MTRLESFIRRLEAQKSVLDFASDYISKSRLSFGGIVCELGLGNGRTYDHLRNRLPQQEIYVFEKFVAAHPDCRPPSGYLIEGDLQETLPTFAQRYRGKAILIHSDIGSGIIADNLAISAFISGHMEQLVCAQGLILSDQLLHVDSRRFIQLDLPENVPKDRYFIYQKVS